MSSNGHRPPSHPVVQAELRRAALDAERLDDLDDLPISRESILGQLLEERDAPIDRSRAEQLIDDLADMTTRLASPLSVGQRTRLAIIAAALRRLSEGHTL